MRSTQKLKLLFVAAEAVPFAKTGGLADVAGSLPRALASMGIDARIGMPRYKEIPVSMKYVTDFPVHMGGKTRTCIVREAGLAASGNSEIAPTGNVSRSPTGNSSKGSTGNNDKNAASNSDISTIGYSNKSRVNVPAYFIDSYDYFYREGIYCHPDDGERFAFFCNALLEMLPRIGFKPDIIHCNDWHTGPVCMLLKEKYSERPFYEGIASIYTIHNLEYQGLFPKEILALFNIGEEVFIPDKVEFYGRFNFMKAGLVYANIINTVSETYAREIQAPCYGEGLDGLLRKREKDLYGIVNGISCEEFDPLTDKMIYVNYDINRLSSKKQNKYALQKETGLPTGDMPVIGVVSRLSSQKGFELVIEKIDEIMKYDLQLIVLGLGEPYYERAFLDIRDKYPGKAAVFIEFNDVLARKIYAGSDMFLMPSRFEPCGLGQIIALRYGTIPVVRETGGLAETVVDYGRDKANGNGFSFREFSSGALLETLKRALALYNGSPEEWHKLVARAMEQDFSWSRSAEKYVELYRLALERQGKEGQP